MSDLNEFMVSGTIELAERKETYGVKTTVFYEALLVSLYSPERGNAKSFKFVVVGFGEAGKKLMSADKNKKVLVKGRLENYSGISKQTGKPYTAFFKIVLKDISYVDDGVSHQTKNIKTDFISSPDDFPF